MQNKESFVFYKSWWNAIKDLPNDVRLEILDGINEYALSGILPEFKPMAKLAFSFIKDDLDRSSTKYKNIVDRNRENGKNGGRPKTQKNPMGILETQEKPNVNVNVNDNDNDNEDISNDISNKIYILSKDSIYESEQRKEYDKIEKDKKSIYDFIQKNKPKIIEPYKDIWNVFAKEYNFPEVKSISAARKRKFKARIKDKEFDFLQVLVKAKDSEFLSSSTFFTWDWIFENDKNYLKILEGNYKNKFFKNKETIKANIL